MPLVPNMSDTIVATLWDTNTYAAGATIPTEVTFFNQPIGTNNKTALDTNMTLVQQLAPPEWINATHIGFKFNSDAIKADVDQIFNNYVLEFWVGNKTYWTSRVDEMPSGNAVYGVTTATSQQAWVNGFPSVNNLRDLRLPQGLPMKDVSGNPYPTDGLTGIIIPQGQTFKIRMYNPSTTATTLDANANGLKLRVSLYGLLSRAVA